MNTVSNEPKAFDVEIAGLPLKLRSSHEESFVRELAEYVNNKISDSLTVTKSGSVQNAALVTCLNIAEELFLLKKQAQSELARIERKAQKLLTEIESNPSGLDY